MSEIPPFARTSPPGGLKRRKIPVSQRAFSSISEVVDELRQDLHGLILLACGQGAVPTNRNRIYTLNSLDMPIVLCPACGGLYKAIGRRSIQDASVELIDQLTHCRLCKTSSREFLLIDDDKPAVGPDGLEFPEVVVPWI